MTEVVTNAWSPATTTSAYVDAPTCVAQTSARRGASAAASAIPGAEVPETSRRYCGQSPAGMLSGGLGSGGGLHAAPVHAGGGVDPLPPPDAPPHPARATTPATAATRGRRIREDPL